MGASLRPLIFFIFLNFPCPLLFIYPCPSQPLGGLAYIAHSGDPKTDLLIAVAGPFTHGPQAVVWGILKGFSIAVGSPGALYVCNSALWMQLSLFCFNLAPAFPLDGGRVVVDACALRAVPLDRAAGLMSWLSLTTGAWPYDFYFILFFIFRFTLFETDAPFSRRRRVFSGPLPLLLCPPRRRRVHRFVGV